MKLILYKIVMPFSVEDYEKGLLYTVAHMSRQETGKGSGVEVLEKRPQPDYTLPDGTTANNCVYTHKLYHCERFVPNWIRKLAYRLYGKNSLKFLEYSHQSFPYMYTESRNMEKPEKINMTVESMHLDGDHGRNERPQFIHTSGLLKRRNSFKGVSMKTLDVTDNIRGLKHLDVTKCVSEKAGIGPLEPSGKKVSWHDNFHEPFMCVYKLAKIRYDIAFGSSLESTFAKKQEFLLHKIHRQMIYLMDEWWPMSLQEVKEFEEQVNEELGINLHRQDIDVETWGSTYKSESRANLLASVKSREKLLEAASKSRENLLDNKKTEDTLPKNASDEKLSEKDTQAAKSQISTSQVSVQPPAHITIKSETIYDKQGSLYANQTYQTNPDYTTEVEPEQTAITRKDQLIDPTSHLRRQSLGDSTMTNNSSDAQTHYMTPTELRPYSDWTVISDKSNQNLTQNHLELQNEDLQSLLSSDLETRYLTPNESIPGKVPA